MFSIHLTALGIIDPKGVLMPGMPHGMKGILLDMSGLD